MEKKSNGFITVKELPPMVVASCFSTGTNPEAEVISYMEGWLSRHGIDTGKQRKFGFDIPVSDEQKKNGFRSFEYWVTVPETTPQGEGVKLKLINQSKYAGLRIKNPYKEPEVVIPAGWKMLHEWAEKYKEKMMKEKVAAGLDEDEDHEEEEEKEKYMLEEIVETKDGVFLDLYYPLE